MVKVEDPKVETPTRSVLNRLALRTEAPVFPEEAADTVIGQVTPSAGTSEARTVYVPVQVFPELSVGSTVMGTAPPLGLAKSTAAVDGSGEPSW